MKSITSVRVEKELLEEAKRYGINEVKEGEEPPKIITDWEPKIVRSTRHCKKKPCKGFYQ